VKVARFKQVNNPVLLNALAHDAKQVLSFATLRKYRDPSDRSRSLIISPVPQLMSCHVIYCITCSFCKKLYICETGRRLGDRFREHLRNVEKDDQNASKPVARHFKDVHANCYCASLLRTQIHATSSMSARALSTKINNRRWPLLQLRLDITILDVRWPLLFFPETDFIHKYLHIVQK